MIMELQKSDCMSLDEIVATLHISKATNYTYMKHLGIEVHKFPFDRRSYVLKTDVERIAAFMKEIRG